MLNVRLFEAKTSPVFKKTLLALSLLSIAQAEAAQESVQLDNVVVTAAGFEQNIIDAPASISVVTREELENQSYTSVIDAVKNIPGVFVTGGGSSQDITIRGMGAAYTLVLVDGRPISAGRATQTNGTSGGKQQLALPPLAMIERIEVIRGPMSSLYGSEAMGGVVNIITRRNSTEWHGSVRSQYTFGMTDVNGDEFHSEVYAGGSLVPERLSLQVNAAYTDTQKSDYVGGEAFNAGESTPATKDKNTGMELSLTPNESDRISLGYREVIQRTEHTAGASAATNSKNRFEKEIITLSHEGNYGDLLLNSYLQRDVTERVQDQKMKETLDILNIQGTYFLNAHTLTFGVQYKEEEFINGQNQLIGTDGGVNLAKRWIAAIYGEADWAITEDFSLTTGLRYNDDEFFGEHLSPRLYGVYRVLPNLALKGGVSTGYKQPTLTQSTPGFGSRTGGGGWQNIAPNPRALSIGSEDVQPETSVNYEFGFALENRESGLDASVMVFHTDYKDKIDSEDTCVSPGGNRNDYSTWSCTFAGGRYLTLRTPVNIGKAEVWGIENSLGYSFLQRGRLDASYTYTKSEQLSGAEKGEPLNEQPRHMLNAKVDWQATDRLNLWANGNYRGEVQEVGGGTLPGYGFIDTGVVYELNKSVDLLAGLYNVFNKEVTSEEYGKVLDGRRFMVGFTADF